MLSVLVTECIHGEVFAVSYYLSETLITFLVKDFASDSIWEPLIGLTVFCIILAAEKLPTGRLCCLPVVSFQVI